MIENFIRVVGNKFQELSNTQNILSFNELVTYLHTDEQTPTHILLEQGVSELQVDLLRKMVAQKHDSSQITLRSYFDTHQRCDGTLTHKHKRCNTLISDPTLVNDDDHVYTSLLLIDDECAELSDHVTGKHVQFMVLLEAARQMVNAVTQKFYSTMAKIYLAESINVNFKAFAYPFRVDLRYHVIEHKLRPTGDGKMTVRVDFLQQDKLLVQLTFAFTVLDRKFVAALESSALKTLCA